MSVFKWDDTTPPLMGGTHTISTGAYAMPSSRKGWRPPLWVSRNPRTIGRVTWITESAVDRFWPKRRTRSMRGK